MADLVIVSMNDKGFWQADMFRDASEIPADEFEVMGCAPDAFCTFAMHGSLEDAATRAKQKWPDAVQRIAGIDEGDDEVPETDDGGEALPGLPL